LRSQIVAVKFIESDVKTDSDGDDRNEDDEGEESRVKRKKQVEYYQQLKTTSDVCVFVGCPNSI